MENLAKEVVEQNQPKYDYEKIASSPDFKHLMTAKKKFLIPLSLFFLIYYFSLPILTSYTTILNTPAIGSITWAWMYAFSQFIMTWVLCMIYVKKAAKFDDQANEIIAQEQTQGE